MCYSIPGRVIEIKDNILTVDYFGQHKKAKNEFLKISVGDYIYAQGGFAVERITAEEAEKSLEGWKELFFKLQEIDLRLAQKSNNLRQIANNLRQKNLGNSCCVHGIIEFSNYCHDDCLYCGLRIGNVALKRYRMTVEEIIQQANYAVKELGFKALVLQSGEDFGFDEEKLVKIIRGIKEKSAALLSLSIGDRDIAIYKRLYQEGVRGVLLRFETGNAALYQKMRPKHLLEGRIGLIRELRETGYLIMTGFLIGLPGQTKEDILKDIELANALGTDMFSFGPFIPHPETPLKDAAAPAKDLVLDTIARTRIMNPNAKILVTTSLETLDKESGLKDGLMSGGNSVMINLTPAQYQKLYDIYPNRAGTEEGVTERIKKVVSLLHTIGRAPTDLGM